MKVVHGLIMVLLMSCGLMLIGSGGYIKLKAHLAGWMITQTWEERQNGVPQKPWPWADTWAVAQLYIPRLGINQYVMQDASGESLAFGAGAVMPINSDGYNFIAGHRDTHFNYLDQLQVGDSVEIKTYQGTVIKYDITATQVIDITKGALSVDERSTGLSLMTCWPMDSIVTGGPLRYLVFGTKHDETANNDH